MKTSILSIALMLLVTTLISCDPSNSPGSFVVTSVKQDVSSGTWRVTHFSERGIDETSDFAGYVFTFGPGNTVSVVKSGVTTNGTWNVSSASSSVKFNIDLGPKIDSNKPLGELTDDWKILSNSTTEIRLTDDNATSNELLTFTKN